MITQKLGMILKFSQHYRHVLFIIQNIGRRAKLSLSRLKVKHVYQTGGLEVNWVGGSTLFKLICNFTHIHGIHNAFPNSGSESV